MRKTFLITSLVCVGLFASIVACTDLAAKNEIKMNGTDSLQKIERGEYLVKITGCDDCHSPKKMGSQGPEIIPEFRLSGYPSTRPIQKPDSNVVQQGWALFGADLTSAVGPWGMSFAGNITSDETGIGNWSEAQFIKALREGKFKGMDNTRPLLPPMPWFAYKNMTDDDLKSIYAFLKTVKPVENVVPAPRQIADIK
jgi:hypothetical protein